ncbi:MAG: methyltransferase domain-containing protein [Planctomycetota bacterium]|nr:MAG: methyltransferase domain-containing protein [Planctomycetota bacterium]
MKFRVRRTVRTLRSLAALAVERASARRRGKPRVPQRASDGLKLNLGCGDKHLTGYLNLDAASSRRRVQPDLCCDLRRLPLASGCADEILAVHVIEHFYAWEAPEVLSEWRRVLAPGGRLVLECPNLLHAAWELLADPERAARPGRDGQRSMWPLYGDPQWRDPLMCHRWGYTPASLERLLCEAGFVKVRREPALFKQRDPRDMRVTGRKPEEPVRCVFAS